MRSGEKTTPGRLKIQWKNYEVKPPVSAPKLLGFIPHRMNPVSAASRQALTIRILACRVVPRLTCHASPNPDVSRRAKPCLGKSHHVCLAVPNPAMARPIKPCLPNRVLPRLIRSCLAPSALPHPDPTRLIMSNPNPSALPGLIAPSPTEHSRALSAMSHRAPPEQTASNQNTS